MLIRAGPCAGAIDRNTATDLQRHSRPCNPPGLIDLNVQLHELCDCLGAYLLVTPTAIQRSIVDGAATNDPAKANLSSTIPAGLSSDIPHPLGMSNWGPLFSDNLWTVLHPSYPSAGIPRQLHPTRGWQRRASTENDECLDSSG